MINLKENFKFIEDRISRACDKAGRDSRDITLLPVSKTKPSSMISEASSFGYKRFGENKVQEIEQKAQELSNEQIELCLIGHLQTNKVGKVAKYASEVHSLDSLKLATALEKALQKEGRGIEALIQVNTSNEEQKFGLDVDRVLSFVDELKGFSSIKIKGLMTLAVFSENETEVRSCFVKLKNLQEQLRQNSSGNFSWDTLSMGMSQDLEWAIEEGSTEVRIGTDLFGSRI